ncbi:MAG TPA: nuclear transport factor 2 family protein [Solirubrobacterales bacterium]|nr:nuclear transport factor 2 family protein [Solirubrobacterales bacterium]
MTHEIEAKEIAEHGFAALSRRDLDGVLEVLDPEVELVPLLTGPDDRIYHGHEGARRWLEEIWAAWEGYRVNLRWLREVDDRTAVIEFIGKLRRHNSEIEFETVAYGVMERAHDPARITSWRFFATEREAFAAAQASPAGERAS